MTRLAIAAAAILIAALLAQTWRLSAWRDRATAAEAQVASYRAAAVALDAHLTAAKAERDHWRDVAQDLSNVEGRDEPLNTYERAVLDRVRQP